jgi:uncharacterized protein (TIGR02598 family)
MRFAKSNSGFSLVEVAIAVAIAGFCLISILGLFAVSVKQTQKSINQSEATSILSRIYCSAISNTNNRIEMTYWNDIGEPVSKEDLTAKYKSSLNIVNNIIYVRIWWPVNAPLENSEGMIETVIYNK